MLDESHDNCVDLGRSNQQTTCMTNLKMVIASKRSVVIYFKDENQMPGFDLLTIDWSLDEMGLPLPQLTFIQTRHSNDTSTTTFAEVDVTRVVAQVKEPLRHYVDDPDNLFPRVALSTPKKLPKDIATLRTAFQLLLPQLTAAQVRVVFIGVRPGPSTWGFDQQHITSGTFGSGVAIISVDKCQEFYGRTFFQLVRLGNDQ